ncbi:leader peptidase (prepilin peptidase) / N-methyltransferase [Micromonospora coriariae]|uniref:Leader peptidase (Prepilin peptidase) / N-methyltransferase n=1 Tax=Micromonospora coriariae TaxID=285665 RepID=A0A1C4VLS6_9ACTN|nr:A24 family peptidase [Micromonospora coriariae]SCE84898.1 leader peptidase (prepilin peptidase) / N-methyltransferase [Micromonospora coriariae]
MPLTGPPAAVPGQENPPDRLPAPSPSSAPRRPARPWLPAVLATVAVSPLLRLAVLRHAVPSGTASRTGCDACGAPVGLTRPWPALGPVGLCGRCRARVGPPPGTVELAAIVGLATVVLLALAGPPGAAPPALAWWLGWTVPAVFVDLAVHRLPDRLTLPAAAGTWLLLGAAVLGGPEPGPWLRAVTAGAGLAVLFAGSTLLLGRRGFGLGDAKLALSVGALLGWYGWPFLLFGLLLAFGLSALVSLGLLAARRARWSTHLPFGPFLLLGTLGALLLAT